MNVIQQRAKQFKKVTSSLDSIVKEICEKLEEFIINLNTSDQLFNKHIDSKGNKLIYRKNGIKYYSYSKYYYDKQKGRKYTGVSFQVGGEYTVENSGEYFKSFDIEYFNDRLLFTSNPIKVDEKGNTTNLYEAFGYDIIGLTKENIQYLIDDKIRPLLLQELRKRL